jgi:hypothetical protein
MTEQALPDPLVPAEVDLRDFPFMPLDITRLLTSETWIEAAGTPMGHALISLWASSWHQVPAASVPDNPAVMARLAFCTPDQWAEADDTVLNGWVLCSDGRWYHPVVAEKALEAWRAKLERKRRVEAAIAARKAKEAAKHAPPAMSDEAHEDCDDQRDDQRDDARDVHQGTGIGTGIKTGTGTGTGTVVKTLSAAQARPTRKARKAPVERTEAQEAAAATWDAYRTAYAARYGTEPVRNALTNANILAFVKRVGAPEAPHIAAWFLGHKGAKYVANTHHTKLLMQDAESLRTQWATNRQTTATAARQADKLGATGDALQTYLGSIRSEA